MIRPHLRRAFLGLIGGIAALIWAGFVSLPHLAGHSSFVDAMESTLLDARFFTFGAIEPPNNVVIVAVDDASLSQNDAASVQGREQLTGLINKIAAQDPRALAVDVLFADARDAVQDAGLAAALASLPSVIAAAGQFDANELGPGLPQTREELWPQPVFSDAARVGLVNIVTDVSGTPRHIPLLFMTSQGIHPSLVLQAATLFSGTSAQFSSGAVQIGSGTVPLDLDLHMPLRVAGPTGTIPTFSATDVMSGTVTTELADKLVVLGYTASALGDRFPTPFDPNTPGVEIIATAAAQLLGSNALRRDTATRRMDAGFGMLLALICTVLVLSLPLSVGFPVAIGLLAAGIAGIWLAFPLGYWFSAALLLYSVLPPLVLASAGRYVRERRKAAKTDRSLFALKQFQSPVLAERIAEDPDFLKSPETRDLVIFFIDLSGFTQLSQDMGPGATEDFLKRFHTAIAHEVEDRHGMVFNYMGDGALAVFGLEAGNPDPAGDAMAVSIAMLDRVKALGQAQDFASPLGCRIGLHAGPVILSRLGHDHHQQVSVTGDSVNLASRLMEIAKADGAAIAATAEFMQAMVGEVPRVPDDTKDVPVRGRAGATRVLLWRT